MKNFEKKQDVIISFTYSPENACRIYLRDLALGLFYITKIAGEIRALRRSFAFITHHAAVISLFNVSFFL